MFLVATSKADLGADFLIARAMERELLVFRLNTEDFPEDFALSIKVAPAEVSFSLRNRKTGHRITDELLSGAVYRKPTRTSRSAEALEDATVRERETSEALRSLWRLIPASRWLNDPQAIWAASNKPLQLLVARDLGLRIPDTLITTVPADILAFHEQHDADLIVKAVKHGFVRRGTNVDLILTSRMTPEAISGIGRADVVVPSIVQPRLRKAADIRVTVVGATLFTALIRSQEHAATSTDWRAAGTICEVDLPHERYHLDERTSSLCLALLRRFNLRFGCLDFVLTESGELFFLELNPNGEWAWIEQLLGYPIRDAILDSLLFRDPQA